MKVTSNAFADQESIPEKYTCDGDNIAPPLTLHDVPADIQSFALIMHDPDIPQEIRKSRGIEEFDHWVVYNIDPKTREIAEGVPVGTLGVNSRGDTGYTGPCPPKDLEPTTHRYIFTVYALNTILDIAPQADRATVEAKLKDHIITQATLTGVYDRS